MADVPVVRRGQAVFAAGGEAVGRVLRSADDYMVVAKGYWFQEHYFVRLEHVAAVEEHAVRLRLRTDALVPDTVSERWTPACDPLGTAGGTDIEPLRAGMAEVEEKQPGLRIAPEPPRPLVQHADPASLPPPRPRPTGGAEPSNPPERDAPRAVTREIIEDYERGASCAGLGEPPES